MRYHWRTNLAVLLGVTAAVSVLGGALLVGDSVRGSLREIAVGRLGRTDHVLASTGYFREALWQDVEARTGVTGAAPLIVANGFVTHEPSSRRASGVLVYGVDERFWAFHGLKPPDGIRISPALAAELGVADGDVLLIRLQRPSEVPVESLFGRKDELGRTVRLTAAGTLSREQLGEFALRPQQTEVRAVFAPLRRIQRDLDVSGEVNTILVAGEAAGDAALRQALTLNDYGVRASASEDRSVLVVEHASGILNDAVEAAARGAAEALDLSAVPVFTYLANSIRLGDREIPYSLVTATDLSLIGTGKDPSRVTDERRATGNGSRARLRQGSSGQARDHGPRATDHAPAFAEAAAGEQRDAELLLNAWAADDLEASIGDRVELEYYVWDPSGGLLTRRAAFTVRGIVLIAGMAADRRLAPEYPGITGSETVASWDPPFPLDLSRVRPQDERYWNDYRTTPKAFIDYARGRELWQSRYGAVTSLRIPVPAGRDSAELLESLRAGLQQRLAPQASGVTITPVRQLALEASRGATDFGEYFVYFSFFLVAAALLLAVLFFRLGIEQRLRQIGILRASGYSVALIRRLLLAEALVLAGCGALAGVIGAVAYGQLIVYGLRTWWIGAVQTTMLTLHVSPLSLVAGAFGGILAALLCVFLSVRSVARQSPRALLTAQALDAAGTLDPSRVRRRRRLTLVLALVGAIMLAIGFISRAAQAAAFFAAGAALLVAWLFTLSGWLRARDARPIAGRGTWAVSRLGFRSAAYRPARSVLSAALIASAAFIIVSVDAFRRGGGELTTDPRSGTGGYALLARSELPLVHNPNDPAGREELLIRAPELHHVRFTRFRVREGEDASCLNLYRPTNPTIVAPEAAFIESGRFQFAASLAETDEERANPWLLLRQRFDDESVPVIADATSMQYVLHLGIGDTFAMDIGADRPLVLRFVAALRDSVLQGELIMAEEQFARLFPMQQGYRMFLVDAPHVRTAGEAVDLAGVLERELQPFGVDAVSTAERLDAFHRVENTYLSTFQALGGLGLLLGTAGLATVMLRNVLERRRELALLRAVGYDARNVSTMILAEAGFLVCAGLAGGVLCAAIAIAPAWLGHGGSAPGAGLAGLLLAVAVAGVLSSMVATRLALSGHLLEALRAE